jgi:hypothetical protein
VKTNLRYALKALRIVLVVTSPLWTAHLVWRWLDWAPARVMVVDYTVPFDDYSEHYALVWLLHHLKVQAPSGGDDWDPTREYVGYEPHDRGAPKRLADADVSGFDWIYVADTYGVYLDDLRGIATRSSHTDFSPLVFGGLSGADATALEDFTNRGGSVVLEFNSFCDPTPQEVRLRVESMLGVEWTGWVGHVFEDLHDRDEVPDWLPRMFAKQYPGQDLPREPTLVLLGASGTLILVSAPSVTAVTPRIVPTALGAQVFGLEEPVPYYHWFSLAREGLDTEVYARIELPDLRGVDSGLLDDRAPGSSPFLTERRVGSSRRIYVGGDFAEADFDPGWSELAGLSYLQSALHAGSGYVTLRPAWWRFFVPVLRELVQWSPPR